ncbi:MAG: hypothetical protein GX996_02360 [Firmicutes bacterium]|nr:hypothetical protein [Bacillota bacterium]
MKKNLFLQGDIGVGKSKMIRENLLPYLAKAGGFFVQRIFIGDSYAGFKLNPLRGVEEYQLNKNVDNLKEVDNLFLYGDEKGNWHKNMQVFENSGRAYLKKSLATKKNLILLDELGGIELDCPVFMEVVMEVLDSGIPALGVLKSPQNVEKLESGLGDKLQNVELEDSYLKRMKNHPQMELLEVTETNYQEVNSKIKAFVEAACTK